MESIRFFIRALVSNRINRDIEIYGSFVNYAEYLKAARGYWESIELDISIGWEAIDETYFYSVFEDSEAEKLLNDLANRNAVDPERMGASIILRHDGYSLIDVRKLNMII